MADTITTKHEVIKEWAEKHHGTPQTIDKPGVENEPIGLRLDFPGKEDDEYLSDATKPRAISWEKFFQLFDELDLAFSYSDETSGDPSYLYRFAPRHPEPIE